MIRTGRFLLDTSRGLVHSLDMKNATQIKVGTLVAHCEMWRGKPARVITLDIVSRETKTCFALAHEKRANWKKLHTEGGVFRANLNDVCYRNRAIVPLTAALYAQAQRDSASGLALALGRVLPED